MTCDIKLKDNTYCQNEVTIFGRWIGYCEEHKKIGKQKDWEHTYDNEVSGDLESGNMDYINNDSQLQEMMVENL